MALRDKIADAVQPHLEPDEQVQVAFGALARNPMKSALSILRRAADRTIVVTDRRILVFRATGSAFLVDIAEYKRRQSPPGVRVSPKAFGKDRRMPITHGYRG